MRTRRRTNNEKEKQTTVFKIIPFLLLRSWIRTLKSDPVKSPPDPQHCLSWFPAESKTLFIKVYLCTGHPVLSWYSAESKTLFIIVYLCAGHCVLPW